MYKQQVPQKYKVIKQLNKLAQLHNLILINLYNNSKLLQLQLQDK